MRYWTLMLVATTLAACDAAPVPSSAVVAVDLPAGCVTRSDFGCSVNHNLVQQLENPEDITRGHGNASPDTGVSTHVVEQYRAGTLPLALSPLQSTSATQ